MALAAGKFLEFSATTNCSSCSWISGPISPEVAFSFNVACAEETIANCFLSDGDIVGSSE